MGLAIGSFCDKWYKQVACGNQKCLHLTCSLSTSTPLALVLLAGLPQGRVGRSVFSLPFRPTLFLSSLSPALPFLTVSHFCIRACLFAVSTDIEIQQMAGWFMRDPRDVAAHKRCHQLLENCHKRHPWLFWLKKLLL